MNDLHRHKCQGRRTVCHPDGLSKLGDESLRDASSPRGHDFFARTGFPQVRIPIDTSGNRPIIPRLISSGDRNRRGAADL
jgi:hypothetical protein